MQRSEQRLGDVFAETDNHGVGFRDCQVFERRPVGGVANYRFVERLVHLFDSLAPRIEAGNAATMAGKSTGKHGRRTTPSQSRCSVVCTYWSLEFPVHVFASAHRLKVNRSTVLRWRTRWTNVAQSKRRRRMRKSTRRPKNMSRMMIHRPASEIEPVIPMLRPTVPRAEATSNKASRKRPCDCG